jgi:tetratricopeptide (TPR) repeat protein
MAMLLLPTLAQAQQLTGAEYYRLRVRADSMARAADIAGVEPILRRLLAYEDRDPEVWLALARSLETQQKKSEAIDAYKKVAQLGFGYTANHYYSIGRLYAQLGQRDSAIAYLRRALAARFPNRERLRTESVFEALKSDASFKKLAGMPPEGLTRDQRWQFDLDYLVEESKRLHASFDQLAFRPEFDSAAAALRRDIPKLDDESIIARMRELVVHLDDGHTGIGFENVIRLPIIMYWFKDGVFVIRDISGPLEPATPGDTTLLGSKIVAVEGVPVADALRRVSAYETRDNDMGVRAFAPFLLGHRSILRAAGILRDTAALRLTVQNRNGQSKTVSLPFVLSGAATSRFNTMPGDSSARPLYLRRRNTLYWLQVLPEARAVYFQFNGVGNDRAMPIPQFARRLTHVLDSTHARALIVDLRHNGGGNSNLFPPFIRSMIVFKEKSPDHQVFVITSRNTFSAAQNFAVAIDQWVGAVFVGEPTGSRANFVGESSAFKMPATGTGANISWRWHQYSQWVDHRKWLAPQVPAEPTSEDYFSGKDRALEAILEILRR